MKPQANVPLADVQFTCPWCGSHCWGSSVNVDGSNQRHCHSSDDRKLPPSGRWCNFTWHERDDARYFRPRRRTPERVLGARLLK